MESDLQHHCFAILAYYNKTKESAENYYRQCAKEYLSKIKKIFSHFSSSLYADFYDLDEENLNIDEENEEINGDTNKDKNIFDLKQNNNKNIIINKSNISNVKRSSSSRKTDIFKSYNIKANITPLFKLTKEFFCKI